MGLGVGIVLAAVVLVLVIWGVRSRRDSNLQSTEVANGTESTQQAEGYAETEPKELNKELYMDAGKDVEERVAELLSQMTLDEKIAQMIQPEQSAISYQEITEYGIGSVLSGGGSAPASGNTVQDWQQHVNHMKQAAVDSRLGIPLLYGCGRDTRAITTCMARRFNPHNIGLGSANDPELMERIGQAVAEEVRATGIQWTFAPTLANPQNELWGRTYEGFGEDVEIVADLGAAFLKGLQGSPDTDGYLDASHALGSAKHYIGEGYTMNGTNQGNVSMEEEEFEKLLREELLLPYQEGDRRRCKNP